MTQAEPVTVLGAGPVGAAIARALAQAGHPVTLGVGHPGARSVDELAAELGSGGAAATPDAAIPASRSVIAAIRATRWPRCGLRLPSASTGDAASPSSS